VSRGLRVAALAVAAACVLSLSACGIAHDAAPRTIDTDNVPVELLQPRTAPATTLGADVPQKEALVYLVDERQRSVVPVTRAVPTPINTQQILRQLIAARPTDEETADGLSNVITRQTRLLGVTEEGGGSLVTIDLDNFFPGLTSEEVTLATAQMVYTLTARRSLDTPVRVQVQVRGRAQELRTAEGRSKMVVSCADFAELGPSESCKTTSGTTTTIDTGTPPVPSTEATPTTSGRE
jgi:Sporulation and spore germination